MERFEGVCCSAHALELSQRVPWEFAPDAQEGEEPEMELFWKDGTESHQRTVRGWREAQGTVDKLLKSGIDFVMLDPEGFDCDVMIEKIAQTLIGPIARQLRENGWMPRRNYPCGCHPRLLCDTHSAMRWEEFATRTGH
jgi:hypothetical protein